MSRSWRLVGGAWRSRAWGVMQLEVSGWGLEIEGGAGES